MYTSKHWPRKFSRKTRRWSEERKVSALKAADDSLKAVIKAKPQRGTCSWCDIRLSFSRRQSFVILITLEWWRESKDRCGAKWPKSMKNVVIKPSAWFLCLRKATCFSITLHFRWRINPMKPRIEFFYYSIYSRWFRMWVFVVAELRLIEGFIYRHGCPIIVVEGFIRKPN